MNENQVYFHLIFYIATIIVSLYTTQDFTNVLPVECSRVFISSQIIVIKKKKIVLKFHFRYCPTYCSEFKTRNHFFRYTKNKKMVCWIWNICCFFKQTCLGFCFCKEFFLYICYYVWDKLLRVSMFDVGLSTKA